MVGLVAVALGLRVGDPIARFGIAGLIIHIGIDAAREMRPVSWT